jgi:toxin CcdB
MGQFAVHRNRNPRTKAAFPLLVDIQTDLLENLQTRVVIPLARAATLTRRPMSNLTPVMRFEGVEFVLLTPQLAGIAAKELGTAAGDLANERQRILAAIDFLLLGF